MAGFDWEQWGRDIVEATKSHVDKSLAPIVARLDKLEAVDVKSIVSEEVKDIRGQMESVVMPEMQEALSAMVREAVSALPEPVDLSPIQDRVKTLISAVEALPPPPEVPDVAAMIAEAIKAVPAPVNLDPVNQQIDELREAIKAIPPLPEPPVIPELPDVAGMIKSAVEAIELPPAPELPDIPAMIKEAVEAIELPPAPELPDIDGMVRSAVDAGLTKGLEEYRDAVNALPVPKDGKSVTLDDVRPLIDDAVSKAVAQIPTPKDGRDGADVMDAFIDKNDHLVLTLSTGKTKDVGCVVGKDVDMDHVLSSIKAMFDTVPKPRDGFGFEDMSVDYDGERTIKLVFQRGDHRKEFPLVMPVILDRGVYSEGKTYARGDCVTWGGSRWIAQKDSVAAKPGSGDEWLLSVKRGQNGKDGVMTIPKAPTPVKLGGR